MQKTSVASNLVSTFLLATLAVSPLKVFAQPAAGEKSENRQPPTRSGSFQDRIVSVQQREDVGVFRILTKEQRGSFRETMAAQRNEMRAIEEQLRTARLDVVTAALAEKVDDDAVRKQALEVGKLEADLAVLRAKALAKVKPPLSAEQIEQIKNPRSFNPGESRIRPVRHVDRPPAGPRDEHDLPVNPKPEN